MNRLDGSGVITKFRQRNYYECIIRNEKETENIWRYIEANPSNWSDDDENPLKARCIMSKDEENASVNRGANLKVFADMETALKWLDVK